MSNFRIGNPENRGNNLKLGGLNWALKYKLKYNLKLTLSRSRRLENIFNSSNLSIFSLSRKSFTLQVGKCDGIFQMSHLLYIFFFSGFFVVSNNKSFFIDSFTAICSSSSLYSAIFLYLLQVYGPQKLWYLKSSTIT